jgi:hypothetical protein
VIEREIDLFCEWLEAGESVAWEKNRSWPQWALRRWDRLCAQTRNELDTIALCEESST